MMKRILAIPIALLIVSLAASSVFAHPATSAKRVVALKPQKVTMVKGVVSGVDAAAGKLRFVTKQNQQKTILVMPFTNIVVMTPTSVQTGSLSSFSVGDSVSAFVIKKPKNKNTFYGYVLIKTIAEVPATNVPSDDAAPTTPPANTAEPPASSTACIPFPAATGTTVTVSTVDELKNALVQAHGSSNLTVFLKDGTYALDNGLWVDASNVTFRGLSGNRDAVTLKGKGMDGSVSHIFWVAGKNVTIADMTIGWVSNHPIQVHGELDADNVKIHNVRIVDGKEQLLKGSYNAGNMSLGADNGVVECSLFEYSAGVGPQSYIGGIDVHNGKNWIVRDNVFKNIRAPNGGLAEHAIHFWSDSQNTLIERNTIINSDRGIGFGLGDRGHGGGVIRNNFIYHDSSSGDVGIGLENAANAKVYNNTIFMENDYSNAIEYRFSGTSGAQIANNLTNKAIARRDSASATLENNVANAQSSWFTAPASGDLHLASDVASVVNAGKTLSDVTADFDGAVRTAGSYDIGADER